MSGVAQAPPDDRLIVDHLRRRFGDAVAVYRFGSSAHGLARAESDVDLAVLAGSRIAAEVRFDTQETLAAELHADVDLVDLRGASTVMAMQVVSTGTLLYEGDAVARGAFEDLTFSAYARLNEERRGILQRVAEEGTIYGR